jgi:hypothetical protein
VSALRYSGEVRIRITYREARFAERYSDGTPRFPNGSYRCYLTGPGGMKATVIVGAPAFLSHAVDCSEAFDEAAHAALSFADHKDADASDPHDDQNWSSQAAYKVDGAGWHVSRTSSAADCWPQEVST